MSTEYKSFQAFRRDEKGSTGFYAKIEDGKVAEVLDVSTYETNYDWDLETPPYYLVGESDKELSSKVARDYYYDFNIRRFGYCIREEAISKEEYEREKVRLKKEEIELQQRGIEYKFFAPVESDFGASTGFYAKIENGKVAEIIDVSTYATSYGWDLENPPYDMIGKSGKELSEVMAHYYDGEDFGDRRPWIAEENLREQEYEMKARNSLERAGVVYKSFEAYSNDYGASTRFCAKIENGKVTEVVIMSEDHWLWNEYRAHNRPYEMIGKSGKKLLHVMDHYYDDDHFADYYINERDLSKQEYEGEKTRLKIKESQLEQRDEVGAERERARAAQGTDKFAEREEILERVSAGIFDYTARPKRRTLRSRRAKDAPVLRAKDAPVINEEQARELERAREKGRATARMLAAKRHIIGTRRARARDAQGTDKFAEREAILREATERVLAKHEYNKRELEGRMEDEKSLAPLYEKELAEFNKKGTKHRTLRNRLREDDLDDWDRSAIKEKLAEDEQQAIEISELRNLLKRNREKVSKLRNELAKDEKNLDKKIATARVAAAKKHIKESR